MAATAVPPFIICHAVAPHAQEAFERAERLRRAEQYFLGPHPDKKRCMAVLNRWVMVENQPPGRDTGTTPYWAPWIQSCVACRNKSCRQHAFVPHSPEQVEHCKTEAAALPEDTIMVALVPAHSDKRMSLITGIRWKDGTPPPTKYYEVPMTDEECLPPKKKKKKKKSAIPQKNSSA